MGNALSALDESNVWNFFGRIEEIEHILKTLQRDDIRGVGIFGMLQIGKSRTLIQVLNQLMTERPQSKYIYQDFKDEYTSDAVVLYDCLKKCFDYLNISPRLFTTLKPKQFQACNACEKCNSKSGCKETDKNVEIAKQAFMKSMKELKDNVVIFLDNVDTLINSDFLNNIFLSFLRGVQECKKVKFVLTSTHKLGFKKTFAEIEIGPLKKSDIVTLIHEVTEGGLQKGDEIYIDAIASLCAGLPLAAEMAGTELKDDNFFMKPSEMLELLVRDRLDALSSKFYPADDRLNVYQKPINEAKDLAPHFALLFHKLNSLTSDTVSLVEMKKAAGENVTDAMLKKNYVRPLRHIYVMGMSGGHEHILSLPGVFRECLTTMEALKEIPDDDHTKKMKSSITQHMREHAWDIGLKLDDDTLGNPIKLESAIKAMDTGKLNDVNERCDREGDADGNENLRMDFLTGGDQDSDRSLQYDCRYVENFQSSCGYTAMSHKGISTEYEMTEEKYDNTNDAVGDFASSGQPVEHSCVSIETERRCNGVYDQIQQTENLADIGFGANDRVASHNAASCLKQVNSNQVGDLNGRMETHNSSDRLRYKESDKMETNVRSNTYLLRGGQTCNNLNKRQISPERLQKHKENEKMFNIKSER